MLSTERIRINIHDVCANHFHSLKFQFSGGVVVFILIRKFPLKLHSELVHSH
jgi:hypothetical protein